MDEDTLSASVLDYLVDVLTLAARVLELVDVPEETTLRQIQELVARCGDLEASAVPLILAAGVSWEMMATDLGVTRQSLHRRLSKKSVGRTERAHVSGPGLPTQWTVQVGLLGERARSLARSDPERTSGEMARKLLTRAAARSPPGPRSPSSRVPSQQPGAGSVHPTPLTTPWAPSRSR